MKKLFLLTTMALPLMAFAQDGKYLVEGNIGHYNAPAKVYMEFRSGTKMNTDSVTLKDGKFQFSGSVGDVPVNAYLIFNAAGTGIKFKDYKSIYLEKGKITVTTDSLIAKAKVNGPKTNQESEELQSAYKVITDGQKVIDDKEKAASPEELKSPEFIRRDKLAQKTLDAQEAALNKKFIVDHPDSYISMNALETYAYGADYGDIAPLYNGLSDKIKQSPGGKEFGDRLPKLKAVAVGAMAPVFAEVDTSGNVISLASFKGKYVLVDFWASWCGPCRQENPNVVKAYNLYKGKNFTIIGVSLDRPGAKDKWLKAIHNDGLAWTQVSDLQFWKSKTADMYAVRAIPQNFLIDPSGKIIAKNLRGSDLEDELAMLFGKI